MQIGRRTFLGTGAVSIGLVAAARPAPALAAPPAPEGVEAWFGPTPGQAQLSRNENPFGPAPSARAAVAECARLGCYYSDRALARLTDLIAERHGLSAAQVVLGSGSTEVLAAVALAWGRKGAIVCPELFWDTTVLYGQNQGGAKVARVPLAPDMGVDLAAMQAAVGSGVALVHVCNPNNPTGMIVPPAALRAFALAVTPKATLLVDEAYNELTDDPAGNSLIELVKAGHDLIVCRTFSKIYGMAGMRVGYAITSEANAAAIRPWLTSFGGNSSGLAAAIASYNDMPYLAASKAAVLEARGVILDAVSRAGLTALPSQANFVFVKVPDADALHAAMQTRGIEIRPAYGKWKQYSRVSTGKLVDVKRYAAALPEVVRA